jgi:4-oxalomesaconate hydratase
MKKALVVSAHCADWCTRASGTIIRLIDQGYEVSVFALTYGEHGESGAFWKQFPNGPIEKCKKLRETEARAAADYLGISDIRFFDYGDYPLEMTNERIQKMTYDILDIRPNVILTHWQNDPINEDHAITAKAVIRAVSGAGMLGARPNTPRHFYPDVFMFETTLPMSEFNHFEIDTYVDITDVFSRKLKAIEKFELQPQLLDLYEKCGKQRGAQANDLARGRKSVKYAEAYKRYFPFVGTTLPVSMFE